MSQEGPLNRELVLAALRTVEAPRRRGNIVALDMVRHVAVCDGHVRVRIDPSVPAGAQREQLRQSAEAAVRALAGVKQVEIAFEAPATRPPAESGPADAGATAPPGGAGRAAPGPMDPVDLPGV